ncbi:MAG TPA: glycine--tRNA ligase [Candidatus Paceibacterota bacterium]|nr:glycine--tRNA ligase [Candidatus Paceibacterota bacterium]
MADQSLMEKIVSLAKRRGFVFPGSEIYGGLAGIYDYGPFGVALRNNIVQSWKETFIQNQENVYEVDTSLILSGDVWKASGHADGFIDPMVKDLETGQNYRADHLLEEAGINPSGMSDQDIEDAIKKNGIKSPDGNELGGVTHFYLMLPTQIGAADASAHHTYLRPETAQGIFVNFKNIIDSIHPKLPFGIAQVGKAFRNEITPRNFLFRVREFEQMELEYFTYPERAKEDFEMWKNIIAAWLSEVGLDMGKVHEYETPAEDLSHYSDRTVDFQFDFPFGRSELYGLANRTSYDLKQHMEKSGESLEYLDPDTNTKVSPYVIEPSVGVGRVLLALLLSAYTEDELGGETRVFLKLPAKLAPVKAMVSPLLKNKPELVEKAREVRKELQKVHPAIAWDDNGNIGKRYRRQDEIGTPFCITIDFDTLGEHPELKDTVTLRHRDTGEQERLSIEDVKKRLIEAIS